MSILSEDIRTFQPIKDQYLVGCYINDITAIVDGPDDMPIHHTEVRSICKELCHKVVDMISDWGIELLDVDDLRPLINTTIKEPRHHFVQIEDLGMNKCIMVTNIDSRKSVMKIVLTVREWAA